MLRRKKGWIGIDLGTRTLKLAQVERDAAGLRIAASAVMRRPKAPKSQGNTVGEDSDRLGQDVSAALALGGGFSGRRAACVLPMRLTDLHVLPVPPGKVAERRAIVAHQLSTMFAADQQPREFDFWETLDTANRGSSATGPGAVASPTAASPTADVNVLSVSRRVVSQVVRDLSKARMRCQLMDGLPFVLARAVRLANISDGGAPVGAIDWGSTSATFCVVSDGRPLFTRHLRKCGFGLLTGAVSQMLGLSEDEATELLTGYGMPDPACQVGKRKEVQEMLAEITAHHLHEIAEEIDKTISYLKMQYSGIVPEKLCLFGSGATVKNVTMLLSEKVQLPVDVWHLPDSDNPPRDELPNPPELLGTAVALSALAWES